MSVIQPFKRRIVIEAVIKAILIGLLVTGLIMVGVATTSLLVFNHAETTFIIIGAIVSSVTGIVVGIIQFLKEKKEKLLQLDKRLDQLGLEERVVTMYEYKNNTSYVAQLQREDTLDKVSKLNSSKLKIKLPIRILSFILAVLLLSITVFAIQIPEEPSNGTEDKEQQIIQDGFEEIEKIIEESKADEEFKEELREEIKDLEDKLEQIEKDETLTEQEKADAKDEAMLETQDKLQDKVEKEDEAMKEIADKLQQSDNELIKDLGDALESQDKDKIDEALDNIKEHFKDPNTTQQDKNNMLGEIFESMQEAPRTDTTDAFEDYVQNMDKGDYDNATEDLKNNLEDILNENQTNKDVADKLDEIRQEITGNTQNENSNLMEDMKDQIFEGDASAQDKVDAEQWLDKNNQQIKDEILNNDNLTEQEKQDAVGDKYQDMKEEIANGMDKDKQQFDKDSELFEDSNNSNFNEIGEALKENNKDKIDNATNNMQQDNQTHTNEAWKEMVEDIIGDLDDILQGDSSEELKDIVSDYKNGLQNALDKFESDQEGAKEDYKNATDKFNSDMKDFMEDFYGGQELGQELMGSLTNGQNELNKDENSPAPSDKEEPGEQGQGKPEQEENKPGQEGDKPNEEPSENPGQSGESQDPTTGEESSGDGVHNKPVEDDTKIYIPGIGEVTLKELAGMGLLDDEFDKMFDKELTTEEREMIANYLDLIKK